MKKLKKRLKKSFLVGSIVIIPLFSILSLIVVISSVPDSFFNYFLKTYTGFCFPGIGLLIFIAFIVLTGFVLTGGWVQRVNWIGKADVILKKIPLVKTMWQLISLSFQYESAIEAFEQETDRVVLVAPYRDGIFQFGLITRGDFSLENEEDDEQKKTVITVFVPNAPSAWGGKDFLFPPEEIIPTNFTVAQLIQLKLTVFTSCPNRCKISGEHFKRILNAQIK